MVNSYSGVWRAGSDNHYLWANANWNSFRGKWEELSREGLRLADMNIHQVAGELRYTGVWRAGSGSHYLWVNTSWDNFRAKAVMSPVIVPVEHEASRCRSLLR